MWRDQSTGSLVAPTGRAFHARPRHAAAGLELVSERGRRTLYRGDVLGSGIRYPSRRAVPSRSDRVRSESRSCTRKDPGMINSSGSARRSSRQSRAHDRRADHEASWSCLGVGQGGGSGVGERISCRDWRGGRAGRCRSLVRAPPRIAGQRGCHHRFCWASLSTKHTRASKAAAGLAGSRTWTWAARHRAAH